MSLRVLWLSNVDFSISNIKSTGTWVFSMFEHIQKDSRVSIIANVTLSAVDNVSVQCINNCKNYLIPNSLVKNDGLPKTRCVQIVSDIISKEQPDIIHIWGTELCWGVIVYKCLQTKIKTLLEIQGLKYLWGKNVFWGGLYNEIYQMRCVLDYLKPKKSIKNIRKSFVNWGISEKQILSLAPNINTQSDWVRHVLKETAPNSRIFKTDILLRGSFLFSDIWLNVHQLNPSPRIFTVVRAHPYKGLHDVIQSLSLVCRSYPSAMLYIAGINVNKIRWKNSGYIIYLLKLIQTLGLEKNVVFLGSLDEFQILDQMYQCDVYVISSYIESYCLALAEALSLGVPSVIAYNSALLELAVDEQSGLYYPTGDYYVCAAKILRIFKDENLRKRLSLTSSSRLRSRINIQKIVDNQIRTYFDLE